jgi:acetyl esterase/lipase
MKCMHVFVSVLLLTICGLLAEKIENLEFAQVNKSSLMLDLYLPAKSEKKAPLVIWVHGGGWKGGSKKNPQISWMTAHGYAVASIDYRLTGVAIFPAQIHDCKGAIRWLRANAKKYNLDSKRFAAAGSSAGGHLVALLGTSGGDNGLEGTVGGNLKHSSSVSAVIDFYGATDFILRSVTQPSRANKKGSVVYKLLGGPANEKTELAKQASSAYYVTPNDPPFLIYHGEKDNTVLLDQSQKIHSVYQKNGLSSTLVIVKGAGHGGKAFFSKQNKQQMLDFLKKSLK